MGYEPDRQNNKRCDRYRERRVLKEEFYASLGLNLISIEHDVFRQSLDQIEDYFCNLFLLLGYDVSLKKADYTISNSAKHCRFWSEDRIIEELQVYIDTDGNFPSKNKLEETRKDLVDAITQHGGFIYFREKLSLKLLQRAHGYWSENNIIAELKPIIEQLGDFPTYEDLKKLNKYDLIRAINRNDGYVHYQKLLGFEPKKKSGDYWTEEVMVSELKKIVDALGKTPTYTEARNHNKTLVSAIDRSKLGFKNLLAKV